MTSPAVPKPKTLICNRCAHCNVEKLNQKCAKGRGGLFRLSIASVLDCADYQKLPTTKKL